MLRTRLAACLCLLVSASLLAAQPAPPRYEVRRLHDPNGTGKFYMGREIAQVMGHLGAGWLDRPEREKEIGRLLSPASERGPEVSRFWRR